MDKTILEKTVKICELIDCYGSFLTIKQKDYAEKYFFENMTLFEIAELENVSRSAILQSVSTAVLKLEQMEKNIGKIKLKKAIMQSIYGEHKTVESLKKSISKIITEE
ncbi:MAG: hypothetical protein RR140_01005 [Clostridia bacterium]